MGETSMSALIAKEAVKIAGQIGRQTAKETSKFSVEQFTFDFPGLLVKLFVFFVIAYTINKIMETIILGENFLFEMLKFFGIVTPATIPKQLADFWKDGFNTGSISIKFWDIVKALALILVIYEWYNWYNAEKTKVNTPSPMTHGVFFLLTSSLALTTFPQIWARIQDLRALNKDIEVNR